jgi:hypothetical protein
MLRIVFRGRRLKQPDSMTLGCYCTKKMPMSCMMANRMAILILKTFKKVHPGISTKDLNMNSAHLLQVWTCVLLDKAGKSPDYICKQLCWLGDTFCMYLCDARVIQDAHS